MGTGSWSTWLSGTNVVATVPVPGHPASERLVREVCQPDGAAVDTAMAPNPGHGPTLLVEPYGEIYLVLIQPEPPHRDAPAMQMPRHSGPVNAVPSARS